jgi:hypothetical protein
MVCGGGGGCAYIFKMVINCGVSHESGAAHTHTHTHATACAQTRAIQIQKTFRPDFMADKSKLIKIDLCDSHDQSVS